MFSPRVFSMVPFSPKYLYVSPTQGFIWRLWKVSTFTTLPYQPKPVGSPVLPQSLSCSFLGQLRVAHTHPLLLCSVMSPHHRALRETHGHSAGASVRRALLPCPVCCLLGPWTWKMFMVSREAVASLGLYMVCSKGSANPPCQQRLFRFYIPISLGKASILKTHFPQQLQC